MPIYPFVCDGCGVEFEVLRKAAALKDPAPCPACSNAARRLFTGISLAGEATPPDSDSSSSNSRTKPQGGWSHSGHSHGAGTGSHSHGLWNR